MNKTNRIFLVTVLFAFLAQISAISQSYDDFYYTLKGKVYLNIVSNKYLVEFPNGVDENLFFQNNIVFDKVKTDIYVVDSDITTIQNVFGQVYFNAVYETLERGYERKILNEIILKFKDDVDETAKNNLISYYGLQETKSTRLYNKYAVNNSLQISKVVFESGIVDYCHPVFIGTPPIPYDGYEPNDPYFDKQFYLHNTGQLINDNHSGTAGADINAPEAWDLTKGNEDIIIAVIDDGLIANHPDIPLSRQLRLPGSNIFWNYDPLNSDPDNPSPIWNDGLNVLENHGNMCTGIVGAEQDNNQGISGIAPECKIMPVKITYYKYNQPESLYGDAITFAHDHGADVISCSWGWEEGECTAEDEITIAIEDALNGGSMVIFAVYDDEKKVNHYENLNANAGFPANANIEGLINVGASDRNDEQANYSPTSIYIDVVAPSGKSNNRIPGESKEVWTTDFLGNDGNNPWPFQNWDPPELGEELPNSGTNYKSYTGRFSGTSAAAPQVSGCIALALSINPALNVHQINGLVKHKADKVGNYNYDWNFLMPGHSKELGYGRLNCYKMVETASQMYSSDVDFYIRDLANDFGIEPNEAEEGEPMWVSPDIWVRNQPDGFEVLEHENPVYSETDPVYVYVRVTNKGETTSYGSDELKLYWAKAAANLSWDGSWNGSGDPVMGDAIGTKNIPILSSGQETIFQFQWMVPDPDDYAGINPDDRWHFCLLSRIVSGSDPMTFAEGTSVYSNTYNNNNIAWKNVTVIDNKADVKNPGAVIAIGNIFRERTTFEIEFKVPQPCVGNSILDEAEVKLTLDDLTYDIWVEGGKQGNNIKELKNKQILITGDPASLTNLTYDVDEWSTLFVGFNFLTDGAVSNKTVFKYLVTERRSSDQMVIGGELFIIKKPGRDLFDADAGEDKTTSKNENVVIDVENIGEDAEYNWYDMQDSLIYSGTSLDVSLDTTTSFRLEVLATTDGFKDYDEVTVNVKQYEITNIAPNPTNGQVTVEFDIEGVSSAYLLITKPFNPNTETIVLDVSQSQVNFDLTGYETGVYGIILICNDQMVDQKLLSVQ